MKSIARRKASGRKVEIWFQDEARVGQVGRTGRVWFERGQRPRGPRDMRHKAAWIFGAVCPARDTGVALVLPVATTEAMQAFLDELALAVPADRHAVLLIDRLSLDGNDIESEQVNRALANNFEELKTRLRQLGFFTDLADASNSQVIAPRFEITHGELRAA